MSRNPTQFTERTDVQDTDQIHGHRLAGSTRSSRWSALTLKTWILTFASGGVGAITTVFGRIGAVVATAGDYLASQITNTPAGGISATTVQAAINELDTEKAAASHTHAATDLASGVVAPARLGSGTPNTSTFLRGDNTWAAPAGGGGGDLLAANNLSDLTNTATARTNLGAAATSHAHSAADLTSGTVPDARFPAALPAVSGANLTALHGPNITTGTIAPTRMGSGLANSTTFLRGDNAWATPPGASAVTGVFSRIGDVVATYGDYTAALVTNTPAGNIAATNVQAALNELDTEKAAVVHAHAAADITSGTIVPARMGSGTPNSTNFLRGDNTWQIPFGGDAALMSAANAFTGANTTAQDIRLLRTALGAGTALTIATHYTASLSANRTLTFTGTPAEGSTTSLKATVTGSVPITLTIPSCKRIGGADTAITSLQLNPGVHVLSWAYLATEWVLADSVGQLDNLAASARPGVGDDTADGYTQGSLWYVTSGGNSGEVWLARSVGAGAASWTQINPSGGGASLSDVAPLGLNSAATAGTGTAASREDHRHAYPLASQIAIVDSGGLITATDIEGALAELAAGKEDKALTTNAQTGTTYTLVLADASRRVTLSNAAAIALTIPTNASVAFPVGTQIILQQLAAGIATVGGSGITLRSNGGVLTTSGQYSCVTLIKDAADTWTIVGGAESMAPVVTTAIFTKTADTTLANIPGLTRDVIAGRTYVLDATLFITLDGTGAGKLALSGTATVSDLRVGFSYYYADGTPGEGYGSFAALNASFSADAITGLAVFRLSGAFTATTSGTITIQFAQNSASGASVVERPATMRLIAA